MKKFLTFVAVAAFAIPFLAPRAEAQFTVIPMLGYDLDAEALFVGLGTEFDLPIGGIPFPVVLRPSVEYYFMESNEFFDYSLFAINGDLIAELAPADGGLGFFAGAGLAVLLASFSSDVPNVPNSSDTDIALNLLGGIEFDTGSLSPFVQARLRLGSGSSIGVMGGLKLSF